VNPDESFYKAVYGYDVTDVLDSIVIEKIVYKGIRNSYIDQNLRRAIESLVQEYCHDLVVNYIVDALESLGYDVDPRHRGFSKYKYYCRYTATKPNTALYIYVHPLAAELPDVGEDERAIIVVRVQVQD